MKKLYKKPKTKTEYDRIMDQLNIIDELACESEQVQSNDEGQAQKLSKAYNKVADFINKYAKR